MRKLLSNRLDRVHAALSRTTTSGLFIPEIDGLRALAIMAVILGHSSDIMRKHALIPNVEGGGANFFWTLLAKGGLGVPIFFAISGFIIALPFAAYHLENARRPKIGDFYLRRLTRLEPPYIINLCVMLVLQLVVNGLDPVRGFQSFAASLFYVHNIVYEQASLINLVAWSLEIELQFYFLAPLFLLIYKIPSAWWRRGILIGATLALVQFRPSGWLVAHSLLGKFEYFAVGLLLADFYFTDWKCRLPQIARRDWVGGCSWVAFLAASFLPNTPWRTLLLVLLLAVAMWATLSGHLLRAVFRQRWVAVFGGMCYTVYLYHSIILDGGIRILRRLIPSSLPSELLYVIYTAINFIVIAVVCAFLFWLLEKPFMRKKWWKRGGSSAGALAAEPARG